ncbi:MAG: histidine--tRNA ligase [Candidatus Sungbacteria bacterium]|nr:histidine--tRNA ligase [Candidatus Sungbacteria bacterium]
MEKSPERKRNKEKLIEPRLPGGFRDALPEDMISKQAMIDTIRGIFERFGFEQMETPAVERTEILVGGEAESSKIIFNVKSSEENWESSDTSLRFDLTVPLARVLAANPEIPKPFKRYQIGKVWRGERQQAGRYREFLQMDVDIIGVRSLDADAEIVQVMYETMKALNVGNFTMRLNNKREVLKTLEEFGVAERARIPTLIAIDKKDKLSPAEWEAEVAKESGLSTDALKKYLWQISGENTLEGSEVKTLREKAEALGVPQSYLIYDASLVRGLGYYTGSIFEVILTDLPSGGSVFGGGRFDGLTSRFSTEALPAVGVSCGVDRLYAALENLGKIKKQPTSTKVLIFNLSPDLAKEYAEFAKTLRDAGTNTAMYLGDDKAFQAQLSYAVKKDIPFALIYGDKEKLTGKISIKNLRNETQEEIPPDDLVSYIKDKI